MEQENKSERSVGYLTPLLHLLITLQISNDEMDNIPHLLTQALDAENMKHKLRQDTKDLIKHIERYIKQLSGPNDLLRQIWAVVPDEDFDSFIQVKKTLIQRMQYSKFEDINEMLAILEDAQRKEKTLDVFELMLNTLAPNEQVRDI